MIGGDLKLTPREKDVVTELAGKEPLKGLMILNKENIAYVTLQEIYNDTVWWKREEKFANDTIIINNMKKAIDIILDRRVWKHQLLADLRQKYNTQNGLEAINDFKNAIDQSGGLKEEGLIEDIKKLRNKRSRVSRRNFGLQWKGTGIIGRLLNTSENLTKEQAVEAIPEILKNL